MVEVTKTIIISGHFGMSYMVTTNGGEYLSVFAKESGQLVDLEETPLLYLAKEEARALAKALAELANGY